MPFILKTFKHIESSIWDNKYLLSSNVEIFLKKWDYNNPVEILDIELWEELYFSPGVLGIYAAYNPNIEFYIIVHNLFLNFDYGIEKFYGVGASKNLYERSKKFGIILPTVRYWVDQEDLDLYTNLD